jgi:hypothetical protein
MFAASEALFSFYQKKLFTSSHRMFAHIRKHIKALFSSQKILQNFSDFPSHRIFRHMHEVLNIDKNKN